MPNREMYIILQDMVLIKNFTFSRQLEGLKVEQLNMAELTRIEHQLDDLLQQTRIKKVSFDKSDM